MFFALTYLKQRVCADGHSLGGRLCLRHRLHRHVADDEKEAGKLVLVDRDECGSIPLYFVKHYVFTSVYYVILLSLAIAGLLEWRKKIKSVAYGG